jgi:hypothetical protein
VKEVLKKKFVNAASIGEILLIAWAINGMLGPSMELSPRYCEMGYPKGAGISDCPEASDN